YLPVREISGSSLPALLEGVSGSSEDWSERDLLYKVLFDLKKDMVEMKRVMGQIMDGDASVRDSEKSIGTVITPIVESMNVSPSMSRYDEHAEVVDIEENLSLMEVEKRLIDKAIRKYAGKRRQAAAELGISERTLYRKIKEYGLEEE
ncbi:MAG: helix-turn-helix domain-containing protein, partial [Bacteroidota bacterium]